MRKYPAFLFFIFFILGEITSLIYRNIPNPDAVIIIFTLIMLLKISKMKTKYIAAFIAGYIALAVNIYHYENNIKTLKNINIKNKKEALIYKINESKHSKILYALLIQKNKKTNIKILIFAPKKTKISKNSKIIFSQKLKFPENKKNYIRYLSKNICAFTYLNNKNFKIIPPEKNIQPLTEKIKNKIKNILTFGFSSKKEANIYAALTIGERNTIPVCLKDIFKNTNTYHIFSISGLHFASIVVFLIWFLNIARINNNLKIAIIIISSLFYLHITEYRIPSMRAFIMALLFILSNNFHRENTALNSLGASGVIILLLFPYSLFSAGFMLSFLAVSGILITNTYLKNIFINEKTPFEKIKGKISLKKHIIRKTYKYFLICLAAWFFTSPVILYFYGKTSLSSIILNMAIIPLISLTIQISIISLLAGLIFKPLSTFPNKIAQLIIHTAIKIVNLTDKNFNIVLSGDKTLIFILVFLIIGLFTAFFIYEEKIKFPVQEKPPMS